MIRLELMVVVTAAVLSASAGGAQSFSRVDSFDKNDTTLGRVIVVVCISMWTPVKPTEPSLWGTNVPSDPAGEAERNLDPLLEGTCCRIKESCNLPGPYDPGDFLALNTYWQETVPDPYPGGDWVVSWSLGVLPDGSPPPLLVLFQDEPINFRDLSGFAGQPLTFAVAVVVQVPPQGAGRCNIGMGYKVTTPGGEIPPTIVDTFGINPCP